MKAGSAPFFSIFVPGAFALAACSPAPSPGPGPPTTVTATTASASATAPAGAAEAACPERHAIGNLAFGPDGQTLVTACAGYQLCKDERGDNLADVWDIPSGKIKHTLDAGQENVLTVDFGQNGWLVTVANPHTGVATVRLFSVADWSMKHDMSFYCTGVAHWSPASTHLGLAGCDGQVATLRLSDMKITERPRDEAHLGGDYGVAMGFSADGKSIYIDDEYQGFQVLDAATLKRRSKPRTVDRTACSGFSPKWERFAWVTEGGALNVLETAARNGKPKALATDKDHACSTLTWLDATHFAVATDDGALRVWDAAGKDASRPLATATGAGAPAYMMADAGGAALAGSYGGGEIALWDVAAGTRKELHASPPAGQADTAPPPSMQWSPNGERLAATAGDRYFIWDRSGNKLAEGQIQVNELGSSLSWSPRGDFLAVLDGSVRLHRVSDGADLTLASIDRDGARLGLAGTSSGAFTAPPELAHCALPAGTPADRRVPHPTLIADFFTGLPLRPD